MDTSNLTSLFFRVIFGSCLVVAFLLMQAAVSAETLEIQYTGLDVTYLNNTIASAGITDPLESVDFMVGGTKDLGLNAPGDSPLSIALNVPGVLNIPDVGGTVTSAAGGSLVLNLPDGDFLNLALGEASVTYVANDIVNIYFLLGGGAAEVLGQLLPVDGEFGEIVAVSFSTNVDAASKIEDGGFVKSFIANGTGEIEGDYVPEPGTITLLLCGLASLICWRRRI